MIIYYIYDLLIINRRLMFKGQQ